MLRGRDIVVTLCIRVCVCPGPLVNYSVFFTETVTLTTCFGLLACTSHKHSLVVARFFVSSS